MFQNRLIHKVTEVASTTWWLRGRQGYRDPSSGPVNGNATRGHAYTSKQK